MGGAATPMTLGAATTRDSHPSEAAALARRQCVSRTHPAEWEHTRAGAHPRPGRVHTLDPGGCTPSTRAGVHPRPGRVYSLDAGGCTHPGGCTPSTPSTISYPLHTAAHQQQVRTRPPCRRYSRQLLAPPEHEASPLVTLGRRRGLSPHRRRTSAPTDGSYDVPGERDAQDQVHQANETRRIKRVATSCSLLLGLTVSQVAAAPTADYSAGEGDIK
eukprot:1129880-Prorocentrum_minimum.AAC.1